jgi:predicted nucleotidyltransferase
MRAFRQSAGLAEHAVDVLHVDEAAAAQTLERFAEAGYLEIAERDRHGSWWLTTVRGNALASASFAKPITRATAQRHLDGLLERVRTYNADRSKPYTVARVTVFGSYLDKSQDRLGDLDLAIQVVRRGSNDEYLKRRDAVIATANRNFGSYLERLVWPLRELVLYLKDRKPAINITDEDVSALTFTQSHPAPRAPLGPHLAPGNNQFVCWLAWMTFPALIPPVAGSTTLPDSASGSFHHPEQPFTHG